MVRKPEYEFGQQFIGTNMKVMYNFLSSKTCPSPVGPDNVSKICDWCVFPVAEALSSLVHCSPKEVLNVLGVCSTMNTRLLTCIHNSV